MVPGGMRNIHEGKVSGQTGTANHNPDRHGTQEYMNIVHQLGNEESDPSLRNASFPLRSPQSGCSPAGSDGTPKAGSRPPLILQSPPPYASPREGAGDQLGDKQQQQLKKMPTLMTPAAATATAVKDEKEMSDIVSSPFKDSTKLTLCLSRVKSSESDPPGELLPGLEHNSDLEGELAYQQVPVFEQNLGAKQQQQQQAGSSQWPGGALLSSSSPHAEAELNALAEIERIEHETANERECCSKEVQDKVLQGASSSGCDGVLENLTDYPVLKVELRCQHNTRGNAGKVTKNTSCAATSLAHRGLLGTPPPARRSPARPTAFTEETPEPAPSSGRATGAPRFSAPTLTWGDLHGRAKRRGEAGPCANGPPSPWGDHSEPLADRAGNGGLGHGPALSTRGAPLAGGLQTLGAMDRGPQWARPPTPGPSRSLSERLLAGLRLRSNTATSGGGGGTDRGFSTGPGYHGGPSGPHPVGHVPAPLDPLGPPFPLPRTGRSVPGSTKRRGGHGHRPTGHSSTPLG